MEFKDNKNINIDNQILIDDNDYQLKSFNKNEIKDELLNLRDILRNDERFYIQYNKIYQYIDSNIQNYALNFDKQNKEIFEKENLFILEKKTNNKSQNTKPIENDIEKFIFKEVITYSENQKKYLNHYYSYFIIYL